jgi:hypothetical protein
MKRFGMYDNDFNNLFECYGQINKSVLTENRPLPSATREPITLSAGNSFPELSKVKIFIQKPGRGADLTNVVNVISVDSDDHDGGVIVTGTEGDKNFNIITTKKTAQVRMIDELGNIENEFITNVPPRFNNNELILIHVEEL